MLLGGEPTNALCVVAKKKRLALTQPRPRIRFGCRWLGKYRLWLQAHQGVCNRHCESCGGKASAEALARASDILTLLPPTRFKGLRGLKLNYPPPSPCSRSGL